MIRPSGVAGNDAVLADRSTAALYVKVGDQLHPVLNLTSARLIAGRADNPTMVKTSELDQFPRGNLLGIPGAPERMVQNTTRDADWTVCDTASGASAGVTVIAGRPADGGERAAALPEHHAVLVENEGRTWLLWDGRRSAIDLNNRAVTDALGLGADVPAPRPIAVGSVQCGSRGAAARRAAHCRCRGAAAVHACRAGTRRRCRRRIRGRQLDPLLRGARRRPAAGFAGLGRDPAQHQLLWARPAAPAERR